jgi:hypothetical protein
MFLEIFDRHCCIKPTRMVKTTELIRLIGELQPASSVKGVSRSMLKLALSSQNVTASNLNLCLKRGTCEMCLLVI